MRVLISGGCKNGKSDYAQRLSKAMCPPGRPLYYMATMRPADGEDYARIARHRLEREGWGFLTIEQPVGIDGIISRCDMEGSLLLDSLTALLTNEMFPCDGPPVMDIEKKLRGDLDRLLGSAKNIVIVSDGIYSDAEKFSCLTEGYRRALGHLERAIAASCDAVLEASFGHIISHRGGDRLPTILKEAGL